MDIDLALQNTMRRSPMESAMHSVASNLGDGHYRLNAYYQSENEATEILGSPISAHIPNPSSLYARPPTQDKRPKTPSMSQNIGDYTVTYDSSTQTWTLNKLIPARGLKSFWSKLVGRPDSEPTPLFSKSGANATNRFLTTVEESTLPQDLKTKVVDVVIQNTDNTGIVEYVAAQVVYSDIDNVWNSNSALTRGSGPMEILAADYVCPRPLTGYTPVRNEIGDKYGTHTAPPIKILGSNKMPIGDGGFHSL